MSDRPSIYIDPELLARVDAGAEAVGRSRSWFVRDALEKVLGLGARIAPVREVPADVLSREDLVKSAKSSRAHLPTCRCAVCKPPKEPK